MSWPHARRRRTVARSDLERATFRFVVGQRLALHFNMRNWHPRKLLSRVRDERTLSKAATATPQPADLEAALPRRRSFTGEYRAAVLAECDAAKRPCAIGAILRREGLYSSHLVDWRRRRAKDGLHVLAPKNTGCPPKGQLARGAENEIARLRRENAALEEKLRRSPIIIEAQKTGGGAGLAGLPRRASTPDESRSRDRTRGRREACVRRAKRVAGHVAPATPSAARRREPPEPAGAVGCRAGERAARPLRPALRRREPRRGLGHPPRQGRPHRVRVGDVPHPSRRASGAGATQRASPPGVCAVGARRERSQPGLVLGPHSDARPRSARLALPLRHLRCLQPQGWG